MAGQSSRDDPKRRGPLDPIVDLANDVDHMQFGRLMGYHLESFSSSNVPCSCNFENLLLQAVDVVNTDAGSLEHLEPCILANKSLWF